MCGGCSCRGCGRSGRDCFLLLCSATSGCVCVRSSMRFLQIALNGCMIVVIWCCHACSVERCRFATGWCEAHCNGCMNGEEAGARNLAFFRVKWLQLAMKGTYVCDCVRRLWLRSFRTRLVSPLRSAASGCVCVRSSLRFLNLWWQIALEWLHDCCHLVLPCVYREMQVCYGMLRNAL